ncbi:MAG: metallophosphoesterase family protein [Sulfitobacter sp.]|jgi:serine/threonine protein phosphatase 1|uniref:metallophosphoesterase family protein n=1 Tax=unclassified Sulfitobacter TaxID=196795 RepID=UPI0007C28150|nr:MULTISPECIES: metallophosphoesterase family protein [unclassified Sulfitobacter]KZX99564.1 serine/threonine protein phosphatase [Sulfitobacter sp. HI0021]KZY00301.1 serine/threonine protein phosphatase [Sulfitobacter sp. HI0027]KZZ01648.1 serine/threonine protein phosphatase [Sulfitobacter sp. HI0076]
MPNPIYAIGDIHGYAAELERVLTLIEEDGGPDARIVFLGDYTDRGPDSKAVIDRLAQGKAEGRNWTFLMGNHDRMFSWFMEDFPRHDPLLLVELNWLNPRLGGDTTLGSYGVPVSGRDRMSEVHEKAREAVPQAHVDFLKTLALSHQTPDHFFAHAGIRPGVPLDDQTENDLLWIRREFHEYTAPHPKLVVHGHTPVDSAMHYGNRVNLDTGAGYGKPLCAAVFEGEDVWVLTQQGRNRLRP